VLLETARDIELKSIEMLDRQSDYHAIHDLSGSLDAEPV
jgi:hypothetical protein